VRVWDAGTGACVATLTGRDGWVSSVAWSPDGAMIASGGDDATVRVWDAGSGATVIVSQMLPRGGLAVWDGQGGLISCNSPAWEHLAWVMPADADHSYLWTLPAEYFGPLPVSSGTAKVAGGDM
ncbi:MAG: hypothetical protein FWF36_09240, partial [Propionibacteriaceae bacterium]|nr:hypothetical protein [Propionibacteriaceae bacterium]